MRTGIANLPLHYGKCPSWLFNKMKLLAANISNFVIYEYGSDELLKRLSDPYWFQSFACVLGFDWHSSGVTTTVCGALKEAFKRNDEIVVCGGKGRTSKKTPNEISSAAEKFSLSTNKIERLIYSSKMSAKIDNACIQDGYNLYHHVFIFNEKGKWCVIQQGMNSKNHYARRYHWLSDEVKSFVEEPNKIACDRKEKKVLDMVAKQSNDVRKISVDIVNDKIFTRQTTIKSFFEKEKVLTMSQIHEIKNLSKQTIASLNKAYEIHPENYEELVAIRGIGPKAIRALALISQLIYGKEPSWEDPVKFSFSHGGKDGYPYFVDRKIYNKSIDILRNAIENAKIGNKEKMFAIKRLNEFLV
ncbi:MAG: DUF763 domain-containing protein [Candidatus Aenigmatarchaeota archaeon]